MDQKHIAFFRLIIRMQRFEDTYSRYEYARPHFRDCRDWSNIYVAYCRKHLLAPMAKNSPQENINRILALVN